MMFSISLRDSFHTAETLGPLMTCLGAEGSMDGDRLSFTFSNELNGGEIAERVSVVKDYIRGLRSGEGARTQVIDHAMPSEVHLTTGPVAVEAFGAFGSGLHETTRGCLELIKRFSHADPAHQKARVLDIGTGTGILALRAWFDGMRDLTVLDISARAVVSAFHNFHINGIADRVRLHLGPVDGIRGQFDLVIANILLETISSIFDAIVERTAPGGTIILSGIRATDAEKMQALFDRHPLLREQERLMVGDWLSLQLVRAA